MSPCPDLPVTSVFQLRLSAVRSAVAGLAQCGKACPPDWLAATAGRLAALTAATLCLLVGRVKVMGAQLPVFTRSVVS